MYFFVNIKRLLFFCRTRKSQDDSARLDAKKEQVKQGKSLAKEERLKQANAKKQLFEQKKKLDTYDKQLQNDLRAAVDQLYPPRYIEILSLRKNRFLESHQHAAEATQEATGEEKTEGKTEEKTEEKRDHSMKLRPCTSNRLKCFQKRRFILPDRFKLPGELLRLCDNCHLPLHDASQCPFPLEVCRSSVVFNPITKPELIENPTEFIESSSKVEPVDNSAVSESVETTSHTNGTTLELTESTLGVNRSSPEPMETTSHVNETLSESIETASHMNGTTLDQMKKASQMDEAASEPMETTSHMNEETSEPIETTSIIIQTMSDVDEAPLESIQTKSESIETACELLQTKVEEDEKTLELMRKKTESMETKPDASVTMLEPVKTKSECRDNQHKFEPSQKLKSRTVCSLCQSTTKSHLRKHCSLLNEAEKQKVWSVVVIC
jgi:hypothetical protein